MSKAEEARRRKVVDGAIGAAVAAIVVGCDATWSEAHAELLDGLGAVARDHADLLAADATEQFRIDAESQFERAVRAEAEVERLRGAILEHRASMLAENGLGAGVMPDKADLELWNRVSEEGR